MYYIYLHIISIFDTTFCIQGIQSAVQNVCSRRRLRSISYASVSIPNSLLLLTILPPGSDLPSIPPVGWYLCCCLADPSARHFLCLRQVLCFEMPRKQKLQADYGRFCDLKFLDTQVTKLWTKHISLVSTVSSLPPSFSPPVNFPVFPSSLTDIQYKYALWLDIAFGSVKKWLT